MHTFERSDRAARRFRRSPTLSEKLLWAELRQLEGFHFRRQAAIGRYVVDFVCHGARLIIEADGGVHAVFAEERDEQRDAWLSDRGYHVLRFANGAIIEDLDAVVAQVRQHLTTRR